MGTGYTRKDTTNNIADGNIINASDLDNEFDGIEDAFDAATGHDHDGSANGAPITKVGPAQDLVVSTGAITPKTDNTVDLGSSSFEFKDLYIDGTANIDSLVADTADINGGTIDGVTINGATNTISNINLASQVTGTLPIANGGTGQTTAGAALNALLPSQTSNAGKFLTTDGSNTSWGDAGGGALTIDNKTANYTVVAGDAGKIINCTANSFTVSLDAAATLGAGFEVTIWNTGTGNITIDPNSSETIDGVSTLILRRGEGTQIVCNGTNWQTGYKKTMRGYSESFESYDPRPTVTGASAFAIGAYANASAFATVALGYDVSATSTSSTAIGRNSGGQGARAVTGTAAMALGGSYASGTDSFAAAIANNTSSYGATGANSVAIGRLAKATGTDAIAIGDSKNATGSGSLAIGGSSTSTASATNAIAIGNDSTASGSGSVVIAAAGTGWGSEATQPSSFALGDGAKSTTIGKFAFASGSTAVGRGIMQSGLFILSESTTDATPKPLTSYNYGAASTNNQVILPNSSTYTFRVQVVGMQQAADGTNTAGYTFEGVIRRGANAAATVLKNSVKTVLQEDVAGWDCDVSADTTNGGLAVTVTGAAATDIRWVATVHTTEVTYA